MKTSTDRILVTLVGSLPRSQAVTDVLFARERGDSLGESAARATIADAVKDAVRRQVAPDVAHLKLQSLAEGAAIASERLWGRH